jgi:hypothetical protein
MSKDQKNLKRPNTALEDQFEFPNFPKWKNGTIQKVLGSDIVVNEPSNIVGEVRSPNCVEFSIRSDEVLSFGPNTRFRVKGTFQKRKLVTDEWQNCVAADYADVIVMPNWWEMLIKDFEIWHGSTKIASSDEGRFVSQYLNTFKYCFMDKKQKKILCPEPCHPGYGVPTEVGDLGWENKAGSEWEAYAKEIFKPNMQLEFTWTPMDTQPFFQFCNYLQESPKILPMPLLDRLLVRVNFIDKQSNIFWIKPAVPPASVFEYRFRLSHFRVVTERLRLQKAFQASLLKTPKTWHYPGLTKFIQSEAVAENSTMYKCVLQKIAMPEGLFIFCLPKDVSTGNYDYQNKKNGLVFQEHNIDRVSLAINNEVFAMTEPNIGTFRDPIIENKIFYDMLHNPPFGMKTNPDRITAAAVHDGFEATNYPLVYMNLTNFGSNSRIVPYVNNGAAINTDQDLEINMTFTQKRSTPEVHYFICFYYTDTNLTLEMRKKGEVSFSFPYMKKF